MVFSGAKILAHSPRCQDNSAHQWHSSVVDCVHNNRTKSTWLSKASALPDIEFSRSGIRENSPVRPNSYESGHTERRTTVTRITWRQGRQPNANMQVERD